jgi:hypothetical protein
MSHWMRLDAAAQRSLDMVDVVEPLCTVQVDDQVCAGAADAVANREVIVCAIVRRRSRHIELRLPVFLSGGTWDPQALHRS